MSMPTINASQLSGFLTIRAELGQSVFIFGRRGSGKSEIVKSWSESQGRKFHDVRLLQCDITDIGGFPHINQGKFEYSPPPFLPEGAHSTLALEELNAAPQLVQAAAYSIPLDKRMGQFPLPDDTFVCALGNLESEGGAVQQIPTPLRDRFACAILETTIDDVATHFVKKGHDPRLVAFLRSRPDLLHADPDVSDMSFPTPRSWERVAHVLKVVPNDTGTLAPYVSADVGEGAALEFCGWLGMCDKLPDPKEVLKNPRKHPIPDELDIRYAMAAGLAHAVDEKTMDALIIVGERMGTEYSIASVKDAITRDPSLGDTPAFSRFVEKNYDFYT